MRATVDSYNQMRAWLSEADIPELESVGVISGSVCRTRGKPRPLKIFYIPKDAVTEEELPKVNRGYAVYIGKRGLEIIKQRKVAGADFPPGLRKVYVSLEGVD